MNIKDMEEQICGWLDATCWCTYAGPEVERDSDGHIDWEEFFSSEQDGGQTQSLTLFTSENEYTIEFSEKDETFLGCKSKDRVLPAGCFNFDTWIEIVHAILGNELRPQPVDMSRFA